MVDRLGDPMPAALDPVLDPGEVGHERFLAMGESALRETCAPLDGARPRPRLPLYLGLPETRPGFGERELETIRSGLARLEHLPVEASNVVISCEGHAAGLVGLAAAAERLRAGGDGMCLVGGIDSYMHPDTMEWLDEHRQLTGGRGRSAFVPGEGAGFCLLATGRAAKQYGLQPLAGLESVAVGQETRLIKTSDVCLGDGLTATVERAVHRLQIPDEMIDEVICDVNGERYRGEEWGFVCLRMSRYFRDPTAYRSPADDWGDLGAASGPLFAMLACEARARGYAKGSRTMIWASSEGGLRGAAVLRFESAETSSRGGVGHV
jgi:3-oxoacyl-[acyl-carrier-protein] synthase-1